MDRRELDHGAAVSGGRALTRRELRAGKKAPEVRAVKGAGGGVAVDIALADPVAHGVPRPVGPRTGSGTTDSTPGTAPEAEAGVDRGDDAWGLAVGWSLRRELPASLEDDPDLDLDDVQWDVVGSQPDQAPIRQVVGPAELAEPAWADEPSRTEERVPVLSGDPEETRFSWDAVIAGAGGDAVVQDVNRELPEQVPDWDLSGQAVGQDRTTQDEAGSAQDAGVVDAGWAEDLSSAGAGGPDRSGDRSGAGGASPGGRRARGLLEGATSDPTLILPPASDDPMMSEVPSEVEQVAPPGSADRLGQPRRVSVLGVGGSADEAGRTQGPVSAPASNPLAALPPLATPPAAVLPSAIPPAVLPSATIPPAVIPSATIPSATIPSAVIPSAVIPPFAIAPVAVPPAATPSSSTVMGSMPPVVAPGPGLPTLDDLLATRPAPVDGPAEWGWRGTVRRLSGGIISPPAGFPEVHERKAIASVQRSLDGPRTVVVINPKGGAHKTTAALLIAAAFGRHRGGYTLAWDNNETRGTLGWRSHHAYQQKTAVDLLEDLERFSDAGASRVGDLDSYVRAQGSAQFDVLASDEDAASAASIDSFAFRALHRTLSRFYRLLVIDTGNNMRASNWQAAVEAADQVVVISTMREDTAQSAAWALDALRATGHGDIVRHAVTVLSQPAPKRDAELAERLQTHFGQLTRRVLEVPYDPALVAGGPIDHDTLSDHSRSAWLQVAAVVAEGL